MTDRDKRKHTRGETDQHQYRRFKEAAREAGCDESPERMDEVIRRAAKLPPPRRDSSYSPPEKPRKEPGKE